MNPLVRGLWTDLGSHEQPMDTGVARGRGPSFINRGRAFTMRSASMHELQMRYVSAGAESQQPGN